MGVGAWVGAIWGRAGSAGQGEVQRAAGVGIGRCPKILARRACHPPRPLPGDFCRQGGGQGGARPAARARAAARAAATQTVLDAWTGPAQGGWDRSTSQAPTDHRLGHAAAPKAARTTGAGCASPRSSAGACGGCFRQFVRQRILGKEGWSAAPPRAVIRRAAVAAGGLVKGESGPRRP